MTRKLVLLRHGQSQWNLDNRFTGWVDVDLTEQGRSEAAAAGKLMKDEGLQFDVAHTSVLKRAIHTLQGALKELDQDWLPVYKSWRLNERHYGGLQGLDKAETAAKHGEEQVKIWRRSYDIPPPPMDLEDLGHPAHDRRYAGLDRNALPGTESLATTLVRVLPYWFDAIAPQLKEGKTVLVTAHGNSAARAVQVPQWCVERGDPRTQHSHRHPVAVRTRRTTRGADLSLPGRPGSGQARRRSGGQPGQGEVGDAGGGCARLVNPGGQPHGLALSAFPRPADPDGRGGAGPGPGLAFPRSRRASAWRSALSAATPPPSSLPVCAICGGKGEVVIIDEQVGCQVTMPCEHCQPSAAADVASTPRSDHGDD